MDVSGASCNTPLKIDMVHLKIIHFAKESHLNQTPPWLCVQNVHFPGCNQGFCENGIDYFTNRKLSVTFWKKFFFGDFPEKFSRFISLCRGGWTLNIIFRLLKNDGNLIHLGLCDVGNQEDIPLANSVTNHSKSTSGCSRMLVKWLVTPIYLGLAPFPVLAQPLFPPKIETHDTALFKHSGDEHLRREGASPANVARGFDLKGQSPWGFNIRYLLLKSYTLEIEHSKKLMIIFYQEFYLFQTIKFRYPFIEFRGCTVPKRKSFYFSPLLLATFCDLVVQPKRSPPSMVQNQHTFKVTWPVARIFFHHFHSFRNYPNDLYWQLLGWNQHHQNFSFLTKRSGKNLGCFKKFTWIWTLIPKFPLKNKAMK